MPLSSSDPRGSAALADATAYLLTRVAEHLQTQGEVFIRGLSTEGFSVATLLNAGRALGLAELAAAEARDLARVLVEDVACSVSDADV